MSLVKNINGKWYKQLTCNKTPTLIEWDPMSEVKNYNRSFLSIPYKDSSCSSRDRIANAAFFSEKNRRWVQKARDSKVWNLV